LIFVSTRDNVEAVTGSLPERVIATSCPEIPVTEAVPSKSSLLTAVDEPLFNVNPLGNVTSIFPSEGNGLIVVKVTVTFGTESWVNVAGSTSVELSAAGLTVCCWVASVQPCDGLSVTVIVGVPETTSLYKKVVELAPDEIVTWVVVVEKLSMENDPVEELELRSSVRSALTSTPAPRAF